MRKFLLRLTFAVIVLGAFSVWLISVGAWPKIVDAVGAGFGHDTAQHVDDFGQGSKALGDSLSQYANKEYEAAKSGNLGSVDYGQLGKVVGSLGTTSSWQRIPTYNRAAFGQPWADVDHNGCDTRDDILGRDLTQIAKRGSCTVLSGTLNDPYTGKVIHFLRGVKTSSAIQIDHIVPLGYAWSAGAYAWTAAQRLAYANDPALLLAVDGPSNEQKSDSGPGQWLPSNKAYQCAYVARFALIASKYNLSVEPADKAAIQRVLTTCK